MPLNLADLNRLTQNDPKLVTLYLQKNTITSEDMGLLLVALEHNTHLGRIEWPEQLPQDDKSKSLKNKIMQLLDANNAAYRTHPTHYEYAVLSQHVYQPHEKNASVIVYDTQDSSQVRHALPDWRVGEIFDLNKENGLYAALYVNHRAGHCVLAFRGTEIAPPGIAAEKPETKTSAASHEDAGYLDFMPSWFKKGVHSVQQSKEKIAHDTYDIVADLTLISGRITAQQVDAYQLVFSAAEFADEQGYRFSLTGHSLGGWLAQLSAFHYGWECYLSQGSSTQASCDNIQVVTFDSPGLQPIIATLEPTVGSIRDKFSGFQDTFNKHVSTVYLTAPSPINTAGRHLGKVYRLMAQIPDMPTFIYQNYLQCAWTIELWPSRLPLPAWLESYKNASKEWLVAKVVEALPSLPSWVAGVESYKNASKAWLAAKVTDVLSLQTVLGHSMVYLLNTFDPTTGRAHNLKQVNNWPVVDWSNTDKTVKSWNKSITKQTKNKLKKTSLFRRLVGDRDDGSFLTGATNQGIDFILEQVIGSLFAMIVPKEVLQGGATVFDWASGTTSHRALDGFLMYAKKFSSFGVDETESLKPSEQFYLRFDKQYHTMSIKKDALILDDLRLKARELITALMDRAKGCSTEHFIVNSYFSSEPFQRLSRQFGTETIYVLGNKKRISLIPQGISSSAFLDQTERLIQLYQIEVPDWQKYAEEQSQIMFNGLTNPPLVRQEGLLQKMLGRYRKQAVITGLFTEDEPQSIDSAYINLMLLKMEQVVDSTQVKESAQSTDLDQHTDLTHPTADFKSTTSRDRQQYHTSFESIYTTKVPFELDGLFNNGQKRYFIAGSAGVGKTIFLHYLTYQWVNQVLWQDQFDWVFLIKLRNLTPDRYPVVTGKPLRWIDVVVQECFDYVLSDSEKQQLQGQLEPLIAQGKVAWLVDGYDEIAGQWHEKSYTEIVNVVKTFFSMEQIILTSRPYAVIRDIKFDQQLEIMGFTNENIEAYIDRYFSLHPLQGQQLHAFIQKQPSIWGVAHIPIVLQMLCHAWKAQPLSGNVNLTQLYLSVITGLLQRYWEKTQIKALPMTGLWQHEIIQPLAQNLAQLAWQGMITGDILLTTSATTLKPLLETGLIKLQNVNKKTRQATVEFIHFTFQEFMAAYYLSQQFILNKAEVPALIAQYKYEPHLEITWWFVAGLLVPHPDKLQLFFDYLLRKPRDLTGFYEYGLLTRCLDESAAAEFASKAVLWKGLQTFWQGMLTHLKHAYQPLLDRLALSSAVAEKLIDIVITQLNHQDSDLQEIMSVITQGLLKAKPELAKGIFLALNEKQLLHFQNTVLDLVQADRSLVEPIFLKLTKIFGSKPNNTFEYRLIYNCVHALSALLQVDLSLSDRVFLLLSRPLVEQHAGMTEFLGLLDIVIKAAPNLAERFLSVLDKPLNHQEKQVRQAAIKLLSNLEQANPLLAKNISSIRDKQLDYKKSGVPEETVEMNLLQTDPSLTKEFFLKFGRQFEEEKISRGTLSKAAAELSSLLKDSSPVTAQIFSEMQKLLKNENSWGVKYCVAKFLISLVKAESALSGEAFSMVEKLLANQHSSVITAAIDALSNLVQVAPNLAKSAFSALEGIFAKDFAGPDSDLKSSVAKLLPTLLQAEPALAKPILSMLGKLIIKDKVWASQPGVARLLLSLLQLEPSLATSISPIVEKLLNDREVGSQFISIVPSLIQADNTLAKPLFSALLKLMDPWSQWRIQEVQTVLINLLAKDPLLIDFMTPVLEEPERLAKHRAKAKETLDTLLQAEQPLNAAMRAALQEQLTNDDWLVRSEALSKLGGLVKEDAVLANKVFPILAKRLSDEEPEVVNETVMALPVLLQADASLVGHILSVISPLYTKHGSPAMQAANALLPLVHRDVHLARRIFTELKKLLDSQSEWSVRYGATRLLPILAKAEPLLAGNIFLLLKKSLTDQHGWVKQGALQAFPALIKADPSLVETIFSVLDRPMQDENQWVKGNAIETLPYVLQINSTFAKSSLLLLEEVFNTASGDQEINIRQQVVKALPSLLQADPALAERIFSLQTKALNNKNWELRKATLETLSYLLQANLRFVEPVLSIFKNALETDMPNVYRYRLDVNEALHTLLATNPQLVKGVLSEFDKPSVQQDRSWLLLDSISILPRLLKTDPIVVKNILSLLSKVISYPDPKFVDTIIYILNPILEVDPSLAKDIYPIINNLFNHFLNLNRPIPDRQESSLIQILQALLERDSLLAENIFSILDKAFSNENLRFSVNAVEIISILLKVDPRLAVRCVPTLEILLSNKNPTVVIEAIEVFPFLLKASPSLARKTISMLNGLFNRLSGLYNLRNKVIAAVMTSLLEADSTLLKDVFLMFSKLLSHQNLSPMAEAIEFLPTFVQTDLNLAKNFRPAFDNCLNHPNKWIREAAVTALPALLKTNFITVEETFEVLEQRLEDISWHVRSDAVKILPTLLNAKPDLTDKIISALSKRLGDTDWAVRQMVITALTDLSQTNALLSKPIILAPTSLYKQESWDISTAPTTSSVLAQPGFTAAERSFLALCKLVDQPSQSTGIREVVIKSLNNLLSVSPDLAEPIFLKLQEWFVSDSLCNDHGTCFYLKSAIAAVITTMLHKNSDSAKSVVSAIFKFIGSVPPHKDGGGFLAVLDEARFTSTEENDTLISALLQASPLTAWPLFSLLREYIGRGEEYRERLMNILLGYTPTLLKACPTLGEPIVNLLVENLCYNMYDENDDLLSTLASLLQTNATLSQPIFLALAQPNFYDGYYRYQAASAEVLFLLLRIDPTLTEKILPLLAELLKSDDDNVRRAALKSFFTTAYIRNGELHFYLQKSHYTVSTLSPQQLQLLAEKIQQSAPSWLQPMLPPPTGFDQVTVSIPVTQQASDISQFGHTRRLLLAAEDEELADTEHRQPSSGSRRYDTSWLPLSLFASLDQYLRGYWQPVVPSKTLPTHRTPVIEVLDEANPNHASDTKPTVGDEKAQRLPEVTLSCTVGSGGVDQQPVTLCAAADYTMYVFPKPSTETPIISFNGQTAPPMHADSYNPQSCRPVEFYGRQSVFCEGQQTNLIYTPQLPAPPFAQVDGNLMLGQITGHFLGSAYRWAQQTLSDWWHPTLVSPPAVSVKQVSVKISGVAFQKRCRKLDARLTRLGDQLAKMPTAQQSALEDLQFALAEHRDQLQEIQDRGYALSETLKELKENIAISQQEIHEELQQWQSSSTPINPVRTNVSFFATPPLPTRVDNGEGIGFTPRQLDAGESKPISICGK